MKKGKFNPWIVFFAVFNIPAGAFAGNEVGNGGDIFYCNNSKAMLVDIYEASTERAIQLDLGPSNLDVSAKVKMAIDRLERLSPLRAKMYQSQADDFDKDTAFISSAQLTPIADVFNWEVPDGCELKQIAIQHTPEFPQDKRYLVSKDLWDLLDSNSKAALILHEVIYREALSNGIQNSVSVRYFNSLLFSHELDRMSIKDFVSTLQLLPFADYEVGGTAIQVVSGGTNNQLEYYSNGEIKSVMGGDKARLTDGRNLTSCGSKCNFGNMVLEFDPNGHLLEARGATIKQGMLAISGDLRFTEDLRIQYIGRQYIAEAYYPGLNIIVGDMQDDKFDQKGDLIQIQGVLTGDMPLGNSTASFGNAGNENDGTKATMTFYSNSAVKTVEAATPFNFVWNSVDGTPVGATTNQIALSSDGSLDKIVNYSTPITLVVGTQSVTFRAGTFLSFYPQGPTLILESGTLNEDTQLPLATGNEKLFPAGSLLHFNQDGKVSDQTN